MVNLAELSGHGGFASTWIAGKDGVIHLIVAGLEASATALYKQVGLISHSADAAFYLVETDHGIQLYDAVLIA